MNIYRLAYYCLSSLAHYGKFYFSKRLPICFHILKFVLRIHSYYKFIILFFLITMFHFHNIIYLSLHSMLFASSLTFAADITNYLLSLLITRVSQNPNFLYAAWTQTQDVHARHLPYHPSMSPETTSDFYRYPIIFHVIVY